MLRDKYLELGLPEKVERSCRRILIQRSHAVHLQEIVLGLDVARREAAAKPLPVMKMFAGLMSRWTMPAQGENSMQADLVSFGIDLFDLDDEVQGAAQD